MYRTGMSTSRNDQVLAVLEILGFDEVRGVVSSKDPENPDVVKDLSPTLNEVAILHVRFPGGEPFCLTLDGATFAKVNQPLLNGIFKKSEELRESRSKIPAAPSSRG